MALFHDVMFIRHALVSISFKDCAAKVNIVGWIGAYESRCAIAQYITNNSHRDVYTHDTHSV